MVRDIAMIPARMGSQRLKQKNLQLLAGLPLIAHAIRKCRAAGLFDEIWVNSEHDAFGEIAEAEGVRFHRRPAALANDTATSEQFVAEFLEQHSCERVFQVHSIAPLLRAEQVRDFVGAMAGDACDSLFSVVEEPLECLYGDTPVNFSFARKTNSQDLVPVRRIVWSITGWRRAPYLAAFRRGECATYAGRRGYFVVDRFAGHVIKTAEDLRLAEALLAVAGTAESPE